jgi:hypothetical protein
LLHTKGRMPTHKTGFWLLMKNVLHVGQRLMVAIQLVLKH